MTVEQLINKLEQIDPKLLVIISDRAGYAPLDEEEIWLGSYFHEDTYSGMVLEHDEVETERAKNPDFFSKSNEEQCVVFVPFFER